MAAEGPLDKNKDCCFLNRGQVWKKMRVSEREDKTIREVKMNERKWMLAKLKRDGETHMNSAVTSFSISFQSGNNS